MDLYMLEALQFNQHPVRHVTLKSLAVFRSRALLCQIVINTGFTVWSKLVMHVLGKR